LQKEWLFNRANAWFMGNFSREESSATENAHKSLVPKYAKRSINMVGNLKQRLFGVAVESDGTKAYVTTEAGELWFVDLQTEIWHLLIHDLKRPRGIAIESDRNVLYAVMNQYDAPKSRWREKPFENKEGLGRLWKVNLQTGDRIPLTGLMKVQEKLSSPSAHANYLEGWGWKAPPGILRWPVSVAIEKSRESLLVTQARAICRVNIKTSTIEYPISIPLCSNLYDLAIEKSGTVLALESGVWGEFSYGRLLRLDLVSGNLKQLGAGWPLTTGIASLPSEKRVLIAQQFPFPFGRIFEYNVDSSTRYIMREWIGLDSPTQVAIPSDSSFALITTHRGLYRIDL
ncbi:hypothetical protein KKA00_00420, partial [bacterium]|nr:hypothetical protein [bacterium]